MRGRTPSWGDRPPLHRGERIRVLRIITRLNIGGPALQIRELWKGLDEDVFDHRIVAGRVMAHEEDFVALRCPELRYTELESLTRGVSGLRDLRSYIRLKAAIEAFRPHIVHTHTAKAGTLGRLAALRTGGARILHTYHGHLLTGYFPDYVTTGIVALERALGRRTDRLVAVGEQVRKDLIEARVGTPDMYVVVPPGLALPPAPSRNDARATFSLPRAAIVVTYVGRMVRIKRMDRLGEAVYRLLRECRDAHFLALGDGPDRRMLEGVLEPVRERCRFVGWRSDVEVAYGCSDIVVLSSDNEGMPVSLIEAGLAGLPSVGTDAGSVREVVEDGVNGLVVAKESTVLYDALRRLVDDRELRRKMGAEGKRLGNERFGAARLVADTERLYLEVLDEGAGAPP